MSMRVLSSECNPWAISEAARKRRPNRQDIRETETLLDDMCIFVPIPKFSSLAELLRWRREVIFS